jgi:hypothetical protein
MCVYKSSKMKCGECNNIFTQQEAEGTVKQSQKGQRDDGKAAVHGIIAGDGASTRNNTN